MSTSREAEGRTGQGPQTRCSTCRTVFQVSATLLHSADTRVRCGECYAIFDALANLVDASAPDPYGQADPDRLDADPTGPAGPTGTAPGAPVKPVPADSSLSGLANDTSALDVTYSDFDLFSEDAELPEVAYLDRTRDAPELDFDSVELDRDETFSDTLFAADMTQQSGDASPAANAPRRDAPETPSGTPDGTGAAEQSGFGTVLPLPPEPEDGTQGEARVALDFRYRDPEAGTDGSRPAEHVPAEPGDVPETSDAPDALDTAAASIPTVVTTDPPAGPPPPAATQPASTGTASPPALDAPPAARRSWWLPVLMVLGLAVLLAGLYVHRQRDALHEDPLIRPVYELVCRITGCEVPLRSALDSIVLLERQMYSHPTLDGVLVIDVVFRNGATFEQGLPAVSIRLSNPSGKLVARRTFQPAEYLDGADARTGMAPGERLRVGLDVNDPGSDASSFVIDFVPADIDR